jgi:hypothetical protein
MPRKSVIPRKKRGPPPTGKGTPIVVRIQPRQLSTLDTWIKQQDAPLSRPEAVRRLIEKGLAGTIALRKRSNETAPKAAEMAGREIDRLLGDQSVPGEERASRKRRLVSGPKEFRDMRGDQPKSKR